MNNPSLFRYQAIGHKGPRIRADRVPAGQGTGCDLLRP